jgi:hypothetical protein
MTFYNFGENKREYQQFYIILFHLQMEQAEQMEHIDNE